MPKYDNDLYALPSKNYRWREIDSIWRCINVQMDMTLADFLWLHGFDIPESITYCIAENDYYWLKFRHSGGLIDIFIKPLNIKNK